MKKMLLVGGSLLLLWELFKKSDKSDSTSEADKKENRIISFYKNEGVDGLGAISKDGSAIIIPAVSDAFYKSAEIPKIKNILAKIGVDYSKEIAQGERLSKIPAPLIVAYIFAESGGKKDIVSHAAYSNFSIQRGAS